jgi:hypothetical protein
MKHFITLTVALLAAASVFAFDSSNGKPVLYTRSLNPNIHSVQIQNYARTPLYPMFELGGTEFVTLKFDDLSPEINTFSYRILHCNSQWQPDDLSESQYISGFTGSYLNNYETSINTFVPYTHYEFTFPNEEAAPTISGNYVIAVYDTDDTDHPVLTARFMVVESVVSVGCNITARTDIDVEKSHQQVNISVRYPNYDISQPSQELKVIVCQNNRTDNVAVIDAPTFYEQRSVNYKMNRDLIFNAGNEYRTLDIASKYVLDHNVERFEYFKPFYHITLYPSKNRSKLQYEPWQTISGRYKVNLQGNPDPDVTADYAFVHFTLPVETPFLDGKVHILGELTEYRLDQSSQMSYNYETRAYEKALLLKQGGYNFLYAYVPDHYTTADLSPFEGNFWQTSNEYAVYVYYRPFGSLYDELIGYWIGFFK